MAGLNDQFDSTKPKNFLEAVGKDLLAKTQLGRLATSLGTLGEKLGIVRLGNKVDKGGKEPLPDFDVLYKEEKDFRTRLVVPQKYLHSSSIPFGQGGDPLVPAGALYPFRNGIIFPFTPVITQEWSANYSTVNPTHSNYPLHFYKNSSVGPISVSGKFAVQNKMDAITWLQTVHSLRALTKMKFGGDSNAGAPPPVCRFFAYGEMQYNNVPVVVQSVRVDLPDGVDYYAASVNQDRLDSKNASSGSMVPILSTITINLLPMYSRAELLELNHVDEYIGYSVSSKTKGFL